MTLPDARQVDRQVLMSGTGRADGSAVFRPNPNAREVSRRVARLPPEYFVWRVEEHWVVVGPTGIFVVGRAGEDAVLAADDTLSLAQRVRSRLSDTIPWVPFVDALIVGADDAPSLPCAVVDIASLELALLSGPQSIDAAGITALRRHVPGVLAELDAETHPAGPLAGPPVADPS